MPTCYKCKKDKQQGGTIKIIFAQQKILKKLGSDEIYICDQCAEREDKLIRYATLIFGLICGLVALGIGYYSSNNGYLNFSLKGLALNCATLIGILLFVAGIIALKTKNSLDTKRFNVIKSKRSDLRRANNFDQTTSIWTSEEYETKLKEAETRHKKELRTLTSPKTSIKPSEWARYVAFGSEDEANQYFDDLLKWCLENKSPVSFKLCRYDSGVRLPRPHFILCITKESNLNAVSKWAGDKFYQYQIETNTYRDFMVEIGTTKISDLPYSNLPFHKNYKDLKIIEIKVQEITQE